MPYADREKQLAAQKEWSLFWRLNNAEAERKRKAEWYQKNKAKAKARTKRQRMEKREADIRDQLNALGK